MNEVVPALCAGVVSTIVCNPLDIMRLRAQLKNNKIITSPFLGLRMGLVTIPTFWGIYFPLYSKLNEKISTPIAAYAACCSASIITAPLWLLRQKSQVSEPHCFKTTPISNYYVGIIPTLFINLNFMIQIPLYEYIKNKFDTSVQNVFFASAISKVASSTITYPLDTIRAMKRQKPNENYLSLLKSRGITDFYRGLPIYLLRGVPYHISVFCTYEYVKSLLNEKDNVR